jgi:hypothetical protein
MFFLLLSFFLPRAQLCIFAAQEVDNNSCFVCFKKILGELRGDKTSVKGVVGV